MIYYIDYLYWVIICSIFMILIFMLNFKNRRHTGFLLLLMIGLVYVPRLLPIDYLTVIKENKSHYAVSDIVDSGKVMENMVSFTDKNFYIVNALKDSEIEPGFYDRIDVIQVRKLIDIKGLHIKFQIETYYKDVYVEDLENLEEARLGEDEDN